MSLYDSWQLENSQTIPRYTGAPLTELKEATGTLQGYYDYSVTGIDQTGRAVLDTPVIPGADMKKWETLKAEADAKLGEFSKREDKENITRDVMGYAQSVASKLKPFVEQAKAMADWEKTLEDKETGLTPRQIALYKSKAKDEYNRNGGFQADSNGKVIRGFVGPKPAKNIDRAELIRKALSIVSPNGGEVIRGSEDGKWKWKVGNRWETISEPDVLRAYETARAMSLDWQAMDAQEIDLDHYAATAGVNDQVAAQYIEGMKDSPLKLEAIKALQQGNSPADVYSAIARRQISASVIDAQTGYARSKAYSTSSSSNINELSDLEKDAVKRQRDNAVPGYIAQGETMTALPGTENFEALQKSKQESAAAVTAVNAKISDLDRKIAGTGNEALKTMWRAQREDELQNLATAKQKQMMFDRVDENIREATAQGMGLGSYKDLKAAAEKKVDNYIDNLKGLVETQKGTKVTMASVVRQLQDGSAVAMGPGKMLIRLQDGTVLNGNPTIANANANADNIRKKDLGAVEEKMSKEFVNPGVATTKVAIPDNSWKEIVKLLPDQKFTDHKGNPADEELLKKVDWSKTPVSGYNSTFNVIPVTLYDAGGNQLGQFNADYNKSNARSNLGNIFVNSKSPEIIRLGEDLKTKLPSYVNERLIRSGFIEEDKDGNPLYFQENGKPVQVRLTRDEYGNYALGKIDGSGNIAIPDRGSLSVAGRLIADLEHNAKFMASEKTKAKKK